jgi:hypothetical protein
MLLYHGTASTYLPSIQKNGLKPSKTRIFQVETSYGDRVPPTHPGVYLSTSRETAEAFAILRASYLNALPGQKVNFPLYQGFYRSEDAPAPLGNAKPILLEIQIDDFSTLHVDEDAASMEAYWHPGSIPASAIVKVDKLDA